MSVNIHSNKRKNEDINDSSNKKYKDNSHCDEYNKIDIDGDKIYFYSSVNSNSIYRLVRLIRKINKDYVNKLSKVVDSKNVKFEPIYLHIQSYGGSVLASMDAIDAILTSRIPIYTVIDGYAASAGTMISIVGKKRYMTKNSYMLVHELSSAMTGKMSQIEDDYMNCSLFMKRIRELYEKHTKLSGNKLKKLLKKDLWLPIEECIKYGLVDGEYKL